MAGMRQSYFITAFMGLAFGGAAFGVIGGLFFTARGIGLFDLALLVAIFNLVIVLAELPCSILFDRISLKFGAVLGLGLNIISFVLYLAGHDFTVLAVAQALAALSIACQSGTLNAFFINGLDRRDPEYLIRLWAKIGMMTAGASFAGGVLGWGLFMFYDGAIWIMAMISYGLALILLMRIREHRIHSPPSWADMMMQLKTVATLRITYLVLACDAIGVGVALYWQIVIVQDDYQGLLWGFVILMASQSAVSLTMRYVPCHLSYVPWLCALCAVFIAAFVFWEGYYGRLAAFFLHVWVKGVLAALLGGWFQFAVPDGVRASASSMISLCSGVLGVVCVMLAGVLARHYGAAYGMTVSILVCTVLFALSFGSVQKAVKG